MRCRDWKMKREIGYQEECMQSLRKKTRFFKMIFFSIPQVPQFIGSMSVMWAIAHLPLPEPKDSRLVTSQGWCSLKGDLGAHLLRHRHGSNYLLIIPLVIGFSLCGRHITLSAWFGCLITSLNYNYNHYAILRSSFTLVLFFWNGWFAILLETLVDVISLKLYIYKDLFLINFSGLCPDKTCTLWLSASLQLAQLCWFEVPLLELCIPDFQDQSL